MAAVEQALLVRQTTSLHHLCCDGDGTSLDEVIADEQQANLLEQLGWEIAAEAIKKKLPQTGSSENQPVNGA